MSRQAPDVRRHEQMEGIAVIQRVLVPLSVLAAIVLVGASSSQARGVDTALENVPVTDPTGVASGAIPEPATTALMAVAAIGLLRGHRR